MALVRWQPFREMSGLQRDMNRWFDDMFSSFNPQDTMEALFAPSAELEDTPSSYILKLEVPGIDPADLDIEVTDESISIRGERKSESKTDDNGVTRTEFHYGQFHRVIPFSTKIDKESVDADYRDGILMLTLPKVEKLEEKKSVKVSVH